MSGLTLQNRRDIFLEILHRKSFDLSGSRNDHFKSPCARIFSGSREALIARLPASRFATFSESHGGSWLKDDANNKPES